MLRRQPPDAAMTFHQLLPVILVAMLFGWCAPPHYASELPTELTAFSFSADDQKLAGGEYYHEYTTEVMAHSRIEVTMASLAVTPYIIIEAANKNIVAETGNSGHPYRTVTTTTIPVGGPVRIIATTGQPQEQGTYLFQVRLLGDMDHAANNPRLIHSRFSKLDTDGERQRSHAIEVKAGEQLEVSHRSHDYDAYLEVTTPDGRFFEDDDSAGERNSLVATTINQSGTMTCIVRPYGDSSTGSYTLEVAGNTDQDVEVIDQLGARRLRGTISTTPGAVDPEENAHHYAFIVEQAGTAAFLANWNNFDGRLELRDGFGNEIDSNDDAFGNEWSALRTTLEPGRYEIILSSYDSSSSGSYELLYLGVEHVMRVGGTATFVDELSDGDDALEDARLADHHIIIGNQGERWACDLSTDGFSPHVIMLGPNGQRWDSGELIKPNRTKLEIEIPAPGLYTVVVTSAEANQRGAYRLIVGPSQAVAEHALLNVRQAVEF